MVINIVIIYYLGCARGTRQEAWTQALHLSRSGRGRILLIYTFMPLAELWLGMKESREFLWVQKALEKPALDLSCPCWPEIRLILKQIYGFGFAPGLTGHDSRSRFQSSSWPAVSCLGYPQEHPGLLRITQPKYLGARPDSLRPFLVLLGSQFWARTCSKMRGELRITQTLAGSLNHGFLLWAHYIKINRIIFSKS